VLVTAALGAGKITVFEVVARRTRIPFVAVTEYAIEPGSVV